jgi:hypothetical protein
MISNSTQETAPPPLNDNKLYAVDERGNGSGQIRSAVCSLVYFDIKFKFGIVVVVVLEW